MLVALFFEHLEAQPQFFLLKSNNNQAKEENTVKDRRIECRVFELEILITTTILIKSSETAIPT